MKQIINCTFLKRFKIRVIHIIRVIRVPFGLDSKISLFLLPVNGGHSSAWLEHQIVVLRVVGSSPIGHP